MSWGVATQNGVSVSLASIVSLSAGVTEFSPADLFTGGVQGAWYDPSDYSTLFQDSAGTTPVTAVEQPVGLMLDKSQGLVLGNELVDTITDPANWTAFGSNTVAADGDALKVTYVSSASGAFSYLSAAKGLSSNLTPGVWYKITGQAKVNTGSANIVVQTTSSWTSQAITSTSYVEFTVYFLAATATGDYLSFSNLSTGEEIWIRAVSVKSLAGNHASQATAASRPVLRARYNQLTYSEQFDNAAWTQNFLYAFGSGSVVNAAVAPNGTTTADKICSSGGTASVSLAASGAVAAQPYVVSCYFKADGKNFAVIQVNLTGGSTLASFFTANLTTGEVGTKQDLIGSMTATATCVAVGTAGWYKFTVNATNSGGNTTLTAFFGLSDAQNNRSSTASTTNGVLIWGADVRLSSTSASMPDYQRIAAATDYATAGFLPYLAFDGTDDSFGTNSINFSATDKMSVCAGVTKLSDAAIGSVAETGANYTNAGAFGVFAPDAAASPRYSFGMTGATGAQNNSTPANYAAPVTSVLQSSMDISVLGYAGMSARINGASVTLSNSGAGVLTTGTFGNYPLYIGRRANSSLPFNGRIYQMVVCGKALSASELASTEAYVATKTGVTL